MKKRNGTVAALGSLVALVALPLMPWAANGQTNETVEPDGVVCLRPLQAGSAVAVRLPLPKDKALAGVRWFNNDGMATFPQLLLAPVSEALPRREDGIAVAQQVRGLSLQWSEVLLPEPLASTARAVDVIFEISPGAELTAEGSGGGVAFGYLRQEGGPLGFVSSDGQQWTRLRKDCRLLVEPLLVARAEGVALLGTPPKSAEPAAPVSWQTALLPPWPNPANPGVRLGFTLARELPVELSVYDLRGRQVTTLLRAPLAAGSHEVAWQGRDDGGRTVGSGIYFARLKAGDQVFSRRLLLIR